MDNIDIFNPNDKVSKYFRLPIEVIRNNENSALFAPLMAISTGYRTGSNKSIGFLVKNRNMSEYFIKYCSSGTGWFEVENKRHVITAGDLILCDRNTLHSYGTSIEDPWSAYWVYFQCNYIDTLFPKLLERKYQIIHLGPDTTIIRYFTDILHKISHGYAVPYLFHATQTLGMMLAYINLRMTTEIDYNPNKYNVIISHMNNHLDKCLDINDLAELLSLSKDHFIKVFYARYGYTPLDYFIRLRMQQACTYLLTTDWTIKKISISLGYDDPYYFSRIFKKKIGMSPNSYRHNYS